MWRDRAILHEAMKHGSVAVVMLTATFVFITVSPAQEL